MLRHLEPIVWAAYQGRLCLSCGVNGVIRNTSIYLSNCIGENIKNLAHVKNYSQLKCYLINGPILLLMD